MTRQPWIPALDLKNGMANPDRGMRPALIGGWKQEKDKKGFALFMDIQKRSGLSLVQVLGIVKGVWEEDNEAVSFSKDAEGRIVKFRLNKRKEEEKITKKVVKMKKNEGLKTVKKGKQAKQVKRPVGKNVKAVASRNGQNPWTPGFGAYAAMEELRIGGTMEQLRKRVLARFKKDKISSSPLGRLDRVIVAIDNTYEEKFKPFKVVRTGKGKNAVLKAMRK